MAAMKKLVLDLDNLKIESFDTEVGGEGVRGTVKAHVTEIGGNSCYPACTAYPCNNLTDWNSCYGGCSDSGCGYEMCKTE